MIAYQVWYSCYEDTGTLGYFLDKTDAEKCLAESALKVGDWTNHGDKVQAMGIAEITIKEASKEAS